MIPDLPEHTCPDIDRVKLLIKGKLSAEDQADAFALLEELRESNRQLRECAERAIDYAENVENAQQVEHQALYLN